MEIWNEFCSYLIDCKERNVSEDRYHEIIESQLSLFGWSRFKGEIVHKERIPSGHGFAEPDILLKKDNVNQVVIEVKKPNHAQHRDDRVQLLSYMRLCMLRVGVYIGEHIEIFYDQQTESNEPVSVFKTDITLDNEDGKTFVNLLRKNNFTKDEIIQFCEMQIIERQKQKTLNIIKQELISGEYNSFIADCIKRHLMSREDSKFSEEQISDMLSTLVFNAIDKEARDTAPSNSYVVPEITLTPKYDNSTKKAKDSTRYSLDNGKILAKNRFALAVVRKYTHLNPQKTYYELEQIFPPEWQGSSGVIRKLDYINEKQYVGGRYFTEADEILTSADGIAFAVTTQWSLHNIQNIIDFAKAQGWQVLSFKK